MAVSIRCKNADCGKPLRAHDDLVGKRIKCTYCGQVQVVAAADPATKQDKRTKPAPAAQYVPAPTPVKRGKSGSHGRILAAGAAAMLVLGVTIGLGAAYMFGLRQESPTPNNDDIVASKDALPAPPIKGNPQQDAAAAGAPDQNPKGDPGAKPEGLPKPKTDPTPKVEPPPEKPDKGLAPLPGVKKGLVKGLGTIPLLDEPTKKELVALKIAANYPGLKYQLKQTGDALVAYSKQMDNASSDAEEQRYRKLRLQAALAYAALAQDMDRLFLPVVLHRMREHRLDQGPYKLLYEKAATDLQVATANLKPGVGQSNAILAARERIYHLATLIGIAEALDEPGLKMRLTAKEAPAVRAAALQRMDDAKNALAESDAKSLASAKQSLAEARKHYDTLLALVVARPLTVLTGHRGAVSNAMLSPDGTRVASVSHDDGVRIWNVSNGQQIAHIKGARNLIGFTPDGHRLLAVNSDSQGKNVKVTLWEPALGKDVHHLKEITDHLGWMSPDGKRLAANISPPGAVRVWDLVTEKETHQLKGHGGYVGSVAFSADGKRIACGATHVVKIWDAGTGMELLSLKQRAERLSFSPDSKVLAGGGLGEDKSVTLWDVATGNELRSLRGHTASVSAVTFGPDGKVLATGSFDQTSKLWDPATGRELLTLAGHTGAIYSVHFSADSKRLATASFDKTVRVVELDLDVLAPPATPEEDADALPKEVIAAWQNALASLGWMGRRQQLLITDCGLGFGEYPGWDERNVPAFKLKWQPGMAAKLPAPPRPFGLYFPFTNFSDDDLAEVAGLQQLVALHIGYTKVTDAGLKHLMTTTRLQRLYLGNTKITGVGLMHLAAVKSLRVLDLELAPLSDADLEGLIAVVQLEELNLRGLKLSDAGLKHVAALKGLRRLSVSGCDKVSDAGLKELTAIGGLRALDLTLTKVSDAGMKELTAFRQLEELALFGNKISDAGLQELARVKTLRVLVLSLGMPLTEPGLAALKKALPRLEVRRI